MIWILILIILIYGTFCFINTEVVLTILDPQDNESETKVGVRFAGLTTFIYSICNSIYGGSLIMSTNNLDENISIHIFHIISLLSVSIFILFQLDKEVGTFKSIEFRG